jgi:hypothetical protein
MRMSISPDISELSPGDEVELTVKMANDGSEEIIPILEVAGLSADLWRLANPIPVIPAGEIGQTSILIRVPADTPPGDRRISVTVRSPLGNAAASAPAALRVGAGDVIAVEASPQAVTGRKGAGLSAIVHNRGSEDLTLRIAGRSEGAGVEVKPAEFRLPAGQSTRVKARFTRAKRSWFRERKHGVVFDVRGHTVPATTTAMFVQRPVVPPVLLRSLAVLVALAVWASAVFVIFTSMAATDEAATDTGEVVDTGPLPPPPPVVLPDPDADPAALDGQVAPPVVIQGAVEGPRNPADTVVVIERVSFGDQGTTNGTGKIAASATPVALASGSVLDKVRTTTDDRGRFRVASGLRANAFYRVSALRAGFEVRSVVVSTSTSTEIDLALTLIPANGQMSGTVVDSNGVALGGVTVEATQGLITYRTVTSSSGEDTGRWTIDALATPATYLITVRQLGYASQTLTVDLDGGQALGGVDAVLTANMGTIRGQITYRDAGVGAITVNLDGDGGKRETTTLTDGPLAGSFTIPSLPYGTYLLTFSGEGWMTQSREVTVDTGDVPVSVRDLVPSTGIIQGIVAQQTVAGGCKYPDTTGTVSETLAPSPCGGVGVTVVNDDGIWRTTTATSDGSFLFSNIPAGEYTVKFERFGYLPEYYTVKLNPGDVVNVPGDATYDAALASALGGGDRGFGPLSTTQVQMRVRPAAPLNEGIIEGFIRDITAQEIAFDDPLIGAFRNGWASLECNGIGSPVRITIVGASSTNCELLQGGGYRLINVDSGVQRVRFNIAGFDEGLVVVRVAPTDISSGGVVNLMPRASVTLNLAGGGDAPVGQAIVFVGPLAVGGSTIDDSDPSVSTCAVSRPRTDPSEIWRVFDADVLSEAELEAYQETHLTRFGLCSTSDLAGDALFPASLGPGGVDIIVPVNATDPTTSASLARTVPLDHRQLTRSLIVAAGENVRLDLRLRRYPVILGTIQQPRESGPGFEPVDVKTELFPNFGANSEVEFCEVDMSPLADGQVLRPCLPFDDPKVRPRISVGEAAGLRRGQFRIDRIPPNEGNTTRVYRLAIVSERGRFSRDPDVGAGSGFENLTFGEDRALSVVMSPTPLQRVKVELRDAQTTLPLTGGFLRVTGTTEYRALDAPPFQEVLRLLCPGPDCVNGTQGDDGRSLNFSPATTSAANQPFDGLSAGTYFSLGVSTFSIFANAFRPGTLELEAIVPGYEPLIVSRSARETIEVEDDDGNKVEEGVIVLELVPLPRRVETTIVAAPLPFTYSGLTVTLTPSGDEGGTPITTQPGPGGSVVFPAVPPGPYILNVSGPGIFTSTLYSPAGRNIPAGAGAEVLPIVFVDRQLTLGVRAANLGAPIVGAEVVISRADGGNLEDGSSDRTLLTCSAAAGVGGAPGCVTAGEAPFTGLRFGDYIVTVSAAGFVGTQVVATSVTAVTQTLNFAFDRFGAVTGIVEGKPSPTLQSIPLSGAQVTLSFNGVNKTASTDSDGRFTFSNLAELVSNSAYTMTITYPGYKTQTTTPVAVANNATTELGTIVLDAADGTFSGTVFDGTLTTVPLSGVTVSVIVGNSVTDTVVTGPTGAFEVNLPPKRPATIRFEQRDAAGNLLRLIVERTETLDGGESVTADITMAAGFSSFGGTVLLRDRTGAPTTSASGASVTASRANGDGLTPASYVVTTGGDGSFLFGTSTRTGTYAVTASAAGYTPNIPVVVLVALNGAGTSTLELIAAPRDVVFDLSSSASSPISGVSVSASSDGETTQVAEVVGNTVTLSALQPGSWTFTTSGGHDLEVPHLDITDGSFTVSVGVGTLTPVVANSELTRYAKITGTVALASYDSSVTVSGFVWGASNAAMTASGPSGTAVVQTEDGTDIFTVWAPSNGDWTLQFSLDDFATASATTSATLSADVAVGEVQVFPAPRDVSVSVTSEAIGVNAGLNGLTLTAYPPDGSALSPVTATPGTTDGTYKFAQLAPAIWTVSTSGGPSLGVPHIDATATVAVPFGTSPIDIADPIITFISLNGEVNGQDYVGAEAAPLSDVIVTATQSAQTVSALSTVGAGTAATWSMGVLAGAQIELSWSKVGYQTASATITAEDATSSAPPSSVTLSASPRDVTVTVSGAPEGLELQASFAGAGLADVNATTSGQTATFVGLVPGVWTVKSLNASTLGVIPFEGLEVTVSVATTADLGLVIAEPIIELVDLLVEVTGVNFSGAATSVSVSAATVNIEAGGNSLELTTGAVGTALFKTTAGLAADVTVSAVGYVTTIAAVTVSTPSTSLPVQLVALERSVTVKVTSSASPGGIEGVTVSAVTAVSAPGAAEVVTTAAGEAGFTLAPGEWTFSVTGAESTGHLDVGPDEASDAAPRTFTVEVGDSGATVNVGLTLQPFDATVSGTVFLVTGDDDASVSAITEVVTVTATSGSLSRTTETSPSGEYSILLTGDRPWQISVSGFAASTTTSVTPLSGATVSGDVTVSAVVRNIGGTISGVDVGATVTIAATANGFAPITQTRTGNGAYTFSGLNAMVTWTITFSVESTDGPITVIRYVAPGVADVTSLDQDLATASVGEIVIILNDTGVDIREGVLMVTVILSDPNPFPQLRTPITKTVTLAVDEADATVSFGPLGTVPGADPFSVEVTADDYAAVVPLSVTAGDEVAVTLTPAARTVVLTLTKDFDATVSTAPKLYDGDSVTLSGTVDPEAGNVFTITGVTPGDWVVQVPGYPDVLISVPIGDTAIEVSFDVQLASVAAAIQFVQDGEVITEGFVGANDPDLAEIQIRLVDADGDLVNSTAEFEVELTTEPAPPAFLIIAPLTGTLVAGQTTVTLEAPDASSGTGEITVSVGSIIATLEILID